MELLREYWPYVIVALAVAIVLGFVLLPPRQRVRLSDSAPVRPHMAPGRPPEGRGLAGEAAAATSDVTGELLGAPVRNKLAGVGKGGDELCQIKGIGPKFEDALNTLGFSRFDQLARLTPTEIERLDA